MRTRLEPLVPVDKPGHFVVDMPGKGPHHFRLPTASQAQRVSDYWDSRPGTVDAKGFEQAGITVGLCWRHESVEFEAKYPSDNPTDTALTAFSEAVQGELEEAGYSLLDISFLGAQIATKMNARVSEALEAQKLAGFTRPPQDATSSP